MEGSGHEDFTFNVNTLDKQEKAGSGLDEVILVFCVHLLQNGGQEEVGLQYLLKFMFSTDLGVSTSTSCVPSSVSSRYVLRRGCSS